MKLISKILIVISIVLIISCKHYHKDYLPQDLDDAMEYFIHNWTNSQIDSFKNGQYNNVHFTVGRWIRNNWIHGNRDTNLVNYFKSIKIYNPDDMSSIILTSLQRRLNKQPIDLKSQADFYIKYWNGINECEKRKRDIAIKNFNKFIVGDYVKVLMPVDTSGGVRNAIEYDCPDTSWTFNPKIDLLINGLITKKFIVDRDSSGVRFSVKIIKINYKNTLIFSDKVNIGGIIEVSPKEISTK